MQACFYKILQLLKTRTVPRPVDLDCPVSFGEPVYKSTLFLKLKQLDLNLLGFDLAVH